MDKRKVISFSLYGTVNKYIGGLLHNCIDINIIYPDFWIYVYLGKEVEWNIWSEKFKNINNLNLVQTNKVGHAVMCQRFAAIDNPEVEIMFSRDCDSRINERDQFCINTFIVSSKRFQIIRDNIQHGVPILGGMWGGKKGIVNFRISDKLPLDAKHGTDQEFLAKEIYPNIRHDVLVFDEFFKFIGESPIKIEAMGDHVGKPYMPVDLNDPFGLHGEWYEI